MTHHHHDDSHHHGHGHGHHHHHHDPGHATHAGPEAEASQDEHSPSPLSAKEKLAKMLDHWVHHNHDHVTSYRLWAQRARSEGLPEVAETLETIAQKSLELTVLLEKARANLPS
ncbi:MAG: hypothetical protein WHS86_01975 [Desulfosoma sp.]